MRFVAPLLLLFLLLACVASGQAVRLSGLRTTPGLDGARFRTGGVAVLGFVGPLEGVGVASRDQLDYPIYRALRDLHPTWPLVGAKTVRASLVQSVDVDQVETLLAESRSGELPYDLLLSASRGKALLTVATLAANQVIKTEAEADDEITYCTTRAVAVRYRIFDLERRTVAWDGVISQDGQRCNTNSRSNSSSNADGAGGFLWSADRRCAREYGERRPLGHLPGRSLDLRRRQQSCHRLCERAARSSGAVL